MSSVTMACVTGRFLLAVIGSKHTHCRDLAPCIRDIEESEPKWHDKNGPDKPVAGGEETPTTTPHGMFSYDAVSYHQLGRRIFSFSHKCK